MNKAKDQPNCHPSVWRRIVAIRDRRINSKNRLGELVKSRDAIKDDLRQLGKTPSGNRTRLCEQFWDTLSAIDYERARIHQLADLSEKAVGEGIEGRLFESNDDLDDADVDEVPDAPLYAGDAQSVGAPDPAPPERKDAEPPPAPIDGPAASLRLDTLGIGEKSVDALRELGLITLGDVARWRSENYGKARLTAVGVSPKDEFALEQALCQTSGGGKPAAPSAGKRGRPRKAASA